MSIEVINDFRNAFCLAVRSEIESRLTVIVAEATLNRRPEPRVPRKFAELTVPEPIEADVTYVLEWEYITAFHVRNESYATADAAAVTLMEGRTLRELSNSKYLEFVRATTSSAEELQSKPLRHWEISTWSGIVDVAAIEAPTIREVRKTHAT
jgi:hypothetical protein